MRVVQFHGVVVFVMVLMVLFLIVLSQITPQEIMVVQ